MAAHDSYRKWSNYLIFYDKCVVLYSVWWINWKLMWIVNVSFMCLVIFRNNSPFFITLVWMTVFSYLSKFSFSRFCLWTEQWNRCFSFTRFLAAHARSLHLPNFAARHLQRFLSTLLIFTFHCLPERKMHNDQYRHNLVLVWGCSQVVEEYV